MILVRKPDATFRDHARAFFVLRRGGWQSSGAYALRERFLLSLILRRSAPLAGAACVHLAACAEPRRTRAPKSAAADLGNKYFAKSSEMISPGAGGLHPSRLTAFAPQDEEIRMAARERFSVFVIPGRAQRVRRKVAGPMTSSAWWRGQHSRCSAPLPPSFACRASCGWSPLPVIPGGMR